MTPRYAIISPSRDEADHLPACIASIAAQTIPPTLWIIVDDGSTDATPQVLADAAARHPFIRVVRRENRGARSVGPGVIEAFYAGLEALDRELGTNFATTTSAPLSPACGGGVMRGSASMTEGVCDPGSQSAPNPALPSAPIDHSAPPADHSAPGTRHAALPLDYICKLDADLELPPRYFERCFQEFDRDPHLGNFSGKVYLRDPDGSLHPERMGDENAIGAAKLYRAACFTDIGGFVRHAGWDGIDGHMCRLRGWVARSTDEPDLRIIHRRLMGSSHLSIAHGRRRWGLAKWYMGSSLPYMLAVATYRLAERPYIRGGLWILQGYLQAMLAKKPRLETPGFRSHLRRYEWSSLLRGKSRTAERFHARIRATKSPPVPAGGTLTPRAAEPDITSTISRGASVSESSARAAP